MLDSAAAGRFFGTMRLELSCRRKNMPKVFYDHDSDLELIRNRKIAVLGYGSQGSAQAQNLLDSGCEVHVALRRERPSWRQAEADGFVVETVAEAAGWADVISILLPDQVHKSVYEQEIQQHLRSGDLLMMAHGFSVHFSHIEAPPDVDVAMVAPISEGALMRRVFLQGMGAPAALAVAQNASGMANEIALAYARALGCTRAGVMLTTFREETETDLFGEQAVLCGGIPALIKAGFETLVEEGYPAELAYFECLHQVKLVIDLMFEGGLSYMSEAISDTAEYGAFVAGPRVVDDHVRESMRQVLRDVQSGEFARRWMREWESSGQELGRMRAAQRNHPLEQVGAELRSLMQSEPSGE